MENCRWQLLKVYYVREPPLARITQHFTGRIVVAQLVGTLSSKAVEEIRKALNVSGDRDIEIDYTRMLLIPLSKLPEDDRKLLEKQLESLSSDVKLIVRRCSRDR